VLLYHEKNRCCLFSFFLIKESLTFLFGAAHVRVQEKRKHKFVLQVFRASAARFWKEINVLRAVGCKRKMRVSLVPMRDFFVASFGKIFSKTRIHLFSAQAWK
jgi:hypothetical protein